jgi:hypothetical protein
MSLADTDVNDVEPSVYRIYHRLTAGASKDIEFGRDEEVFAS